jgi:hypothetical protein
MTTSTAIEDEQPPGPSQCWCCGTVEDPARLVHLGNHPEVVVCIRCAHSLSKWAWELEDQTKIGLAVRARDSFRRLRKTVVRRGWHNNKLLGRGLRWIGRFTP